MHTFLPIPEGPSDVGNPWAAVKLMEARVRKFAAAAAASSLSVTAVVPVDAKAPDARRRWALRREDEFLKEFRATLMGADDLYAQALKEPASTPSAP